MTVTGGITHLVVARDFRQYSEYLRDLRSEGCMDQTRYVYTPSSVWGYHHDRVKIVYLPGWMGNTSHHEFHKVIEALDTLRILQLATEKMEEEE